MVHYWTNADDLALAVLQGLRNAEATLPRDGWIRGDAPSNEQLLSEIRDLHTRNEELSKRINEEKKGRQKEAINLNLGFVRKVSFTTTKSRRKTKAKVEVKASDVVTEFRLIEPVSETSIDESIRGAVAVKTMIKFDQLSIEAEELEWGLMFFAMNQVITLRYSLLGVDIAHGPHWLAANALAKVEGVELKRPS